MNLILLNEDGNLMDTLFLAAICALKNTRVPDVVLVKNTVKVNLEKYKYLNVHHLPICTTFSFIKNSSASSFEDSKFPVVDATAKEEKLAVSRLSICMNVFEDICGMQTLGMMEVD